MFILSEYLPDNLLLFALQVLNGLLERVGGLRVLVLARGSAALHEAQLDQGVSVIEAHWLVPLRYVRLGNEATD